jgi:hypothetical protein
MANQVNTFTEENTKLRERLAAMTHQELVAASVWLRRNHWLISVQELERLRDEPAELIR